MLLSDLYSVKLFNIYHASYTISKELFLNRVLIYHSDTHRNFLCLSIQSVDISCVTPCQGIQSSFGLWIPRRGFLIPGTEFRFFVSGTWIPDCNR